jgi:hypothetical protein
MQTTTELTTKEAIKALQSEIKILAQTLPKAEQSKRVILRRAENKETAAKLLNFIDVFNYVKKTRFMLSNRAPKALIKTNAADIYEYIYETASDKVAEKLEAVDQGELKRRFERFEIVLTNVNLFLFFFPEKTQEQARKTQKAFTCTNMVDMACKILLFNDGAFTRIVDAYKAQK